MTGVDLGTIASHPGFRPFTPDANVPPRPHIPPGEPTVDPALVDGPYRPQPGPWQPTHHRLTQLRRHLRRARRDTNRYRRQLDQLTDALDGAESALIDRNGSVWLPLGGGWRHPQYGTHTAEQLNERYGPTRPVLLIDLDGDEEAVA